VVTLLGEAEAVAPPFDDVPLPPPVTAPLSSVDEPSSDDDELEPLPPEALLLLPDEDCVAKDALATSAGSCPDTRTAATTNQTAMNSATAPAIARRRSIRVRAARACRSTCAFADVMPRIVISPRIKPVRNS
jgi:hypothetical protein